MQDVVEALAHYLGGAGNTLDEVDVRNAMCELFAELLADAQSVDDVQGVLDAIAADAAFAQVLERFFGCLLCEQFVRLHYERLLARVGEDNARGLLDSIRDYIKEEVRGLARERGLTAIDWTGSEAEQVGSRIFAKTLYVFGG